MTGKLKKLYPMLLGTFTLILIALPLFVNETSKFAIYRKDPNKIYVEPTDKLPKPPTVNNPLGTDKMGRDIMARLVLATRNSILLAFSYSSISAAIGIFIGIIIGSFNFSTCMLISKLIESLQTLPFSYILILIFYYFSKQGNYNILEVAITLALIHGWIPFSFLTRNSTMVIKNLDYVKASQTMGSSNFRIATRHIFPEIFSSISSLIPMRISKSLTTFEVVNYLQKENRRFYPSLGELLSYMEMGREYLWVWGKPLFVLLAINIILALISLKLKKHMKYFISS
ncbi:ABC transporter permease subunit [Borrelia sp. BU AG58]|uniref:ABC transporter permease subunit n=1 Tax=Borrelia sp. BU AG58 TaxID=2887345 RepID=UPI001E485251|nr:ABC transporter permease subunit [Borrelia sp. BU AG58]UER68042.1 ABC transporter permease subunit [Borrelia sp. BU AG58]